MQIPACRYLHYFVRRINKDEQWKREARIANPCLRNAGVRSTEHSELIKKRAKQMRINKDEQGKCELRIAVHIIS